VTEGRRRLLDAARLVLFLPTEVEAAPLLAASTHLESLEVVGGSWRLVRLGGVDALVVIGGYDKANAAHALTCLFEAGSPSLVALLGIGGAYPGHGLSLGDLVVGTEEVYADTGSSTLEGWVSTRSFGLPLIRVAGREYFNSYRLDERLVTWVRDMFNSEGWPDPKPRVELGRCLTLSQVTGREEDALVLEERWCALAESMEGAAAAQICALYHAPFIEVRAISNIVGKRAREAWDVDGAAARLARAAELLCRHVDRLPGLGQFEGAPLPGEE
jgi:futalosine hydrolase